MDFAPNIAVFCDYENVAIGVRDAKYDKFDIALALERLLDKGNVVVKKAYADWERYKTDRRALHQAAFELIEIPHVSYSGKNSADIRMVVDALDLCYTKSHVDLFCLITGDSDFSPLVSKLRENNKKVIGLGVKNSSSDLLIDNCDEFIYYDDLVKHRPGQKRKAARSKSRPRSSESKGRSDSGGRGGRPVDPEISEEKREKALEMVLDTVDSLFRDRDDNLWGSMIKQTLKRKRPNFNENFHGYRSFNELLEDCRERGLLEIQKDDKSGGYLVVSFGPKA